MHSGIIFDMKTVTLNLHYMVRGNFFISFLASVAFVSSIVSCAPQARYVEFEERVPAEFDLPVGGREIAIFTVKEHFDSTFTTGIMGGFMAKLAEDRSVGLDRIRNYLVSDPDYARDSAILRRILTERGAGLNFVISDAVMEEPVRKTDSYYEVMVIPYSARLGVYDSLSNCIFENVFADSIFIKSFRYGGEKIGEAEEYMAEISFEMGETLASALSPQWKGENRLLAVFSGNAWTKACRMAQDFKWEDAMEIWMRLAGSANPMHSAYAAYNVAVGCEVLGNIGLAKKWTEYSLARMQTREALALKERLGL